MVKTQHIIAACLILVVGMMAYNTFVVRADTANLEPVLAQGSANRSVKEMMAVPFMRTTGEEAIAIIAKSTVKRAGEADSDEWHLVMYGLKSRRNLEFIAARRIQYDLSLVGYNDDRGNPSVSDLRKKWKEDGESGD